MSKSVTGQGVTVIDRIWKFFSSITLAVVVFSIISLVSIVGTVIEQQAEPARNIKLLEKFFGPGNAAGAYKVVEALGFTDMFHSWWFVVLLFIFAANLIICSLERLPKKWKAVKEPIKPLSAERFDTIPIKREVVVGHKGEAAREAVQGAFKRLGIRGQVIEQDGAVQVYGERARYSRLGVYVTHLSILLILVGAVAGIFFGFNGHLNLLEGSSSGAAYTMNGKEIPLGFEIRCNDFEVSFYDNSDTPKSYKSWLSILEGGREVKRQEIEVNSPLRYKGITFYQASYGFSPSRESVFKFSVTGKGGMKQEAGIRFGESFRIPGTEVEGKVADFSPALGIDDQGRLYTYTEMMNNPAVFVVFSEGGKPKYQQWILKRYPQTWKVADGVVEFKDLWGSQYTGLQVRRDPGVWVVYLGCLVMAIGLYAVFFMSHRRVWMRLTAEKNGTRVKIGAMSNKNRITFEQKIEKAIQGLGQAEAGKK